MSFLGKVPSINRGGGKGTVDGPKKRAFICNWGRSVGDFYILKGDATNNRKLGRGGTSGEGPDGK